MSVQKKKTSYEGDNVHLFQFYLEKSGEHEAIIDGIRKYMPEEFKDIATGKTSLEVLGVGSGGGQADVEVLAILQKACPGLSLSSDIVEGSKELTDSFKALVKKTPNLQKVKFNWHIMDSEDFEEEQKSKAFGDVKMYDFIHMIQMIYYVTDLKGTLKFYQSLLKPNGKFMILIEAENGGWDCLWTRFSKVLLNPPLTEYRSSEKIEECLNELGMEYKLYDVPNEFDITECFDSDAQTGKHLLNYMTDTKDFNNSFTAVKREKMLKYIRNRCSKEKDGRVFFDSDLKMIVVEG